VKLSIDVLKFLTAAIKMARPALKMTSGDAKFPNIHEIDYHFTEVAPPSNSGCI
jgi:hypothetical protein